MLGKKFSLSLSRGLLGKGVGLVYQDSPFLIKLVHT